MHKVTNGTTGKAVGVIIGVAAAIAAAAALVQRANASSDSVNGLKPANTVAGRDDPSHGEPIDFPSSGGGSGLIQAPNKRVTVVTPNESSVVILSDDPAVREQTIKNLAEGTGTTGKESITGVKTGTRNDSFGNKSTIYYTPEGKILSSKQEVFDDYLEKTFTPEVSGVFTIPNTKQVSVLEALQTGKPANVTNFLTERPELFPEAKSDTAFLKRAQALKPTLTVGNPGASSSAAVPNFSRLAALGTDLSKVDILGVQNPNFLGEIKSGSGPLTAAQKILIDQQRLKTDPRNQTFAQRAEIEANKAKAAAASANRAAIEAGVTPGFDAVAAKAFLRSKGYNVTGDITPKTFASISAALQGRKA